MAQKIVGLDWLRAIAAILVMIGHARAFLFVDFSELANDPTVVAKVFYLLTGLGTYSVIIFFVLSGYLVAGSVDRAYHEGRWSWKEYAVHRVVRLGIVLLPVLVMTAVFDWLGASQFDPAYYRGEFGAEFASAPNEPVANGVLVFLGNAFFLHNIIVPVYGSNGPLWSIAYEFWYYVAFPLGFFALKPGRYQLFFAALFVLTMWFIGLDLAVLFPTWLFGYFAWKARDGLLGRLVATKAIYALVMVFALFVVMSALKFVNDYSIGSLYITAVAAFFAVIALSNPVFDHGARLAEFLSKISYSLYLVHFPLMALLSSMRHVARFDALGNGMVLFGVYILSSFLLAWCVHWLFERHTATLQRAILRNMRQRPRLGAAG
ncbi:acyltransferase [Thioclava sp. F28-4]|uniref:acyltransferase family protein n=1 Tax=Thioclava sp. F28-4 TaxID=1915315 RepID=UPI000998A6EB|nr:acyltransferase [Thioclava sp. F28-4]OOY05795.1 hypothetical protein BMI87_07210 [Thioclava sp. F28-4]